MYSSINSNIEFENQAQKDHLKAVSQPELRVLELKNIYVTHSGLALKGFFPVEITFFSFISKERKRNLFRYALFKKFTEKKIRAIENASFVHHIWSNGYHHWICESLLKACYLDPQTPIYLPSDYPDFAIESLQFLGFKNIHLIPIKTGLKFKKAKVVPNPISGLVPSENLLLIREKIFAKLNLEKNSSPVKIYISRRKATLRKISNEDDMISVLKKYNYTIIESEKLSFEEQVRLYSKCSVLISNHGAGLTNCLFMPENSIVFEMYRKLPKEGYMNLCYYRMCKSLNLRYMIQFGELDSNNQPNVSADRQNIQIDIPSFIKNIELIEEKIHA